MKLTVKQEKFAQNLFDGMNQSAAYLRAGYSSKSSGTIRSAACRLATNVNIRRRLSELLQKAESEKVFSVQKRRERLSEIVRTNITQFIKQGADGSWVVVPDSTNSPAIQEIHSRTQYKGDGGKRTVYTTIKLFDALKAIDLLNKMDRLYEPENQRPSVDSANQNNMIIHVRDVETKMAGLH